MANDLSNTVGVNVAKAHFSELLDRIECGEEIVITRYGSPVALMVPIRHISTPEQRQKAVEAMLVAAKRRSLRGLKIKHLVDHGRP
jgi:prevent-host-death family protein